ESFAAGADREAGAGRVGGEQDLGTAQEAGDVVQADFADRQAARRVEEEAILRQASATAQRSEPVELVGGGREWGAGRACGREANCDAPILAGGLNVALDAENEAPGLPVVTGLPAAQPAVEVGVAAGDGRRYGVGRHV